MTCALTTVQPSPITESVMTASGPMVQPSPIAGRAAQVGAGRARWCRAPPRRRRRRRRRTGSGIVTPARIRSSRRRRWIAASQAARSTRSFTPAAASGSSATIAATRPGHRLEGVGQVQLALGVGGAEAARGPPRGPRGRRRRGRRCTRRSRAPRGRRRAPRPPGHGAVGAAHHAAVRPGVVDPADEHRDVARLGRRAPATIRAISADGSSGVSPHAITTVSHAASSPARPTCAASPVPSWRSCTTTATSAGSTSRTASAPWPTTTTTCPTPASPEGVEHPVDHRAAGDRVDHLRQGGLHPGPLAGGEDDSADAHAVGRVRPGWRKGVLPGWGGRIRTPDRGTKTRCLTSWLRPSTHGRSGPEYRPTGRTIRPARARGSGVEDRPRRATTGTSSSEVSPVSTLTTSIVSARQCDAHAHALLEHPVLEARRELAGDLERVHPHRLVGVEAHQDHVALVAGQRPARGG